MPTSQEDFTRQNPPISVDSTSTGIPDSEQGIAAEQTYYIAAGDFLIVKLPDEKNFTEPEVNLDGSITLSSLGNFKDEGLTIEELENYPFISENGKITTCLLSLIGKRSINIIGRG